MFRCQFTISRTSDLVSEKTEDSFHDMLDNDALLHSLSYCPTESTLAIQFSPFLE